MLTKKGLERAAKLDPECVKVVEIVKELHEKMEDVDKNYLFVTAVEESNLPLFATTITQPDSFWATMLMMTKYTYQITPEDKMVDFKKYFVHYIGSVCELLSVEATEENND